MEEISAWLNEVLLVEAVEWARGLLAAVVSSPQWAGPLFALAVLAGSAAASPTLTLAALVFAAALIVPLDAATEPMARGWLGTLAITGMVLLAAFAFALRRRGARQLRRINRLFAEKTELQHRLDREITWRRAAEQHDASAARAAGEGPSPAVRPVP